MNRKVLISMLLFTLVLVGLGYCADDEYNRWGQTDLNALLRRELPRDWVQLGHSRGGVSFVATGTTAIPTGYSVCFIICSSSAKTLANAEQPGKILELIAVDDDDTGAVTITPATSIGWASASMDADGETLTLQYIDDTYGWAIVGISGTTITGKNSGAHASY